MKKGNIADTVTSLLAPTITSLGYTLWDVEYRKEGADYHLEITIDKEEGITIEDCELVHRTIDPLLDEADPIPDAYILDVSSPGIERVLRTDCHLAYAIGRKVEVRFFAAKGGAKSLTGILSSADAEGISLTLPDGESQSYTRDEISKISTVFFE